jgi:hypothetical protein
VRRHPWGDVPREENTWESTYHEIFMGMNDIQPL